MECKSRDKSNESTLSTPGNGLGQIQIQLDFGFSLLLDLDLVGHGYPLTLDLIRLDFVG